MSASQNVKNKAVALVATSPEKEKEEKEAAALARFTKLLVSLRYWCLGRAHEGPESFYKTLEALNFALEYHTGKRKDGFTPEFVHQLEIAHYLRTLEGSIKNLSDVLICALLHDVVEDYFVSIEVIESRFGKKNAQSIKALSKKYKESGSEVVTSVAEEVYFDVISKDEQASIVKAADRINNMGSMLGVFSVAKQKAYVRECKQYFLPLIKKAKRNFPWQEAAYENAKLVIEGQIKLFDALHQENK